MSDLSRVCKVTELAKMLQVLLIIAKHPAQYDAHELAASMGVSRATVYRYLDDARHMGADVALVLDARGKCRGYEFRNWPSCRRTVETWYGLEARRELRDELLSRV